MFRFRRELENEGWYNRTERKQSGHLKGKTSKGWVRSQGLDGGRGRTAP